MNQSNRLVVTAQVHHSKDDDPEPKKWARSKEPSRDLDEINVASCAKESIKDGDQKVDTKSMEERSWIKTEMNKIKQAIRTLEQTLESVINLKRVAEKYASELMGMLHKVYAQVHEDTETTKGIRIERFNRKTKDRSFEIGDLVYLKDMSVKIGLSKKLRKPWKGPYRIIEVVGPVTYKIRKVGSWDEQVVHINRLKQYFGIPSNRSEEEDFSEEEDDDRNDQDTKRVNIEAAREEGDNEGEPPRFILPPWFQQTKLEPETVEQEETVTEDEDEEEEEEEEEERPLRRSTRIRRPPDRLSYSR